MAGDLKSEADDARRRVSGYPPEQKKELLERARTAIEGGKIPKWCYPPVPVPVQALRGFIAQHGQSVAVLTLWTKELGGYQFVTIGADSIHADAAVNLRNIITEALNLTPLETLEDLRSDHPNVSLTLEQLDFLLWLLGYIYSASDTMDAGHKEYVQRYHDQLLPIFGLAKEKIVNKPA